MRYAVALAICAAGIAYGIIQTSHPALFKKITDRGNAPKWMTHGWDPYSRNTRVGGQVWIVLFSGAAIWVLIKAMQHYQLLPPGLKP